MHVKPLEQRNLEVAMTPHKKKELTIKNMRYIDQAKNKIFDIRGRTENNLHMVGILS